MPHHDLRNTIARETIARKMELLRSQKDAIEEMILRVGEKEKEVGAGGDVWSNLRVKAEALRTLPLAHCEKAKDCARKALEFLERQDKFACHRSIKAAEEWSRRLGAQITSVQQQAGYAILFSDVLQQWIDSDGKDSAEDDLLGGAKSRAETDKSRSKDPIPLAPEPQNGFDVRHFLEQHGAKPALLKVLEESRSVTRRFGDRILGESVTAADVKTAMESLAADAKQYGQDMRRQLLDESRKPIVLGELSEAFTSTWRNIERWEWPASGVATSSQVHLNGKERLHLSLDVVQAVFLQVVGAKWAVRFSQVLSQLHLNDSWPVPTEFRGVTGDDKVAEETENQLELLRAVNKTQAQEQTLLDLRFGGLLQERTSSYRSSTTELLSGSISAGGFEAAYEGSDAGVGTKDECAWKTSVTAQLPARKYGEMYKQMTADVQLLRIGAPRSNAAFMHADLRDFGASVPHRVALDVLRFFGMPPKWLTWYGTFLRLPMRITEDSGNGDGSGKMAVRLNQRGTPFGLLASAVSNELLLVVLDIALACAADVTAHRNHDDVWIWSTGSERVSRAWTVMGEFTALTGLAWNEEKSGLTVVAFGAETGTSSGTAVSNAPKSKEWSQRPLRWGVLFLKEDGGWAVDEDLVDSHAEAARRELESASDARSLLGKINIYNRYAAFLVRNCGVPIGFPDDTFVDAYRTVIHRFDTVFTHGIGAFAWLSAELSKAFPSHAANIELQEAMLLWPLRFGGFELHPHELMMFLHHKTLHRSEKDGEEDQDEADRRWSFAAVEKDCRAGYEELQEMWNSDLVKKEFHNVGTGHGTTRMRAWVQECQDKQPEFMSYDRYLRHSLLHSRKWANMHRLYATARPCDPEKLEELMLESFTDTLCDRFGSLHEHGALVATALVPQSAVLDIQAATKQLFNTN